MRGTGSLLGNRKLDLIDIYTSHYFCYTHAYQSCDGEDAMVSWFRSFWQKVKKPLEVIAIIAACLLVIALIVLVLLTYIFHLNVQGLTGKNLWDWLQLLIIPVVLAIGGYLFNFATSRTEREIASDRQREDALQAYINNMSALLLEKNLRKSGEGDEVRNVARVRTLTVLPRLDKNRKATVLLFLHESGLIITGKSIVDLRDADLSGAFLRLANLSEANLRGTNLCGANLSFATLTKADLSLAHLEKADLSFVHLNDATLRFVHLEEANLYATGLRRTNLKGAYLNGACMNNTFLEGADLDQATLYEADLSDAHLKDAKVTDEQFKQAKSLKGTIMLNGKKHA